MVQKRGFFQGETIIKVPIESLWVKKKPTATTTKQSLTQKRSTFLFLSLPNST